MSKSEWTDRAASIRAIIVDVDGVLTDGGLYYFAENQVAVRFHVRDGLGIRLAQRAGMLIGLISGRDIPEVRRRAEELDFDEIHLGVQEKAPVIEDLLARRKLRPEEVCFIGDDVIDIPAMHAVGLSVAVGDAHPAVRRIASWTTTAKGGEGAVRETIDMIIAAREESS